MPLSCYVKVAKLTKAQVAAREQLADSIPGATFVYCRVPGTGWQSWFDGPNLGQPFDSQFTDQVARGMAKIEADEVGTGGVLWWLACDDVTLHRATIVCATQDPDGADRAMEDLAPGDRFLVSRRYAADDAPVVGDRIWRSV